MSSKNDRMRFVVVGIVTVMVFGVGGSAIADFVICDPRPVDEAINSANTMNPSGCSFVHDGLKLYFSANRGVEREIWVSERESPDASWGEAVNLGPNINGQAGNKTEPTISPDDLELYFKHYSGGNHLMRSTRASKNEPWGLAAEFTGLGDAWSLDFAPDELSVYFNSNRSGGYGGSDIWVATRVTTDDNWGEAVNLGPNLNDSGWQIAPSISNDGLAVFFVNWTTRRILMCIRATTDDDWGPAIDLGPAVHGQASWVSYPEISPDGSNLYFSSATRSGYPELFWQVSIKPLVDFNADGIVDSADMCIMVDQWGTDNSSCDIGPMPWGDGIVDVEDLIVLAEHLFEEFPTVEQVE